MHLQIPQSLTPFGEAITVIALFFIGPHLLKAFRFREWIGKRSTMNLKEFGLRDPKLASTRFRVFRLKLVDQD